MVLRSGKRRSVEKEDKVVKKHSKKSPKIAKTLDKSSDQVPQKVQSCPVPSEEEEDEVPEDVGFESAKTDCLEGTKVQKEQENLARQKKELNRFKQTDREKMKKNKGGNKRVDVEKQEEDKEVKKHLKKSPKIAKTLDKSSDKVPPKVQSCPVPSEEEEDDEVPEDVGFASAKTDFLEAIKAQKEQEKLALQKKKELNRLKQTEREKMKKNKRVDDDKALSQDFLKEIANIDQKEKKEEEVNSIKKWDINLVMDKEEEEDEGQSHNFAVVSKKDEQRLNNVADSVLNFKQRLMFGDRHQRDSALELKRKQMKKTQIGGKTKRPC